MSFEGSGFFCVVGLLMLGLLAAGAGCTSVAGSPLNATEWKLVSYDNGSTMTPVLNGTTITAEFTQDQMSGTAGCNHYFATYRVDGSSLRVEGAGSTEMYCTTPGVMDQESVYLSLFGIVQRYAVEGDRLTLSGDGGRTLLVYEKVIPLSSRPLVNTTWVLDGFVSGDAAFSVIAGTRITAVFSADGHLSGSAGCNQYFAEYTVNGSTLTVSGVGSTKMYCTTPEGVMHQETTYLNALAAAEGYAIEEDRLGILDRQGKGLLEFRAVD
jgi:heat shock protein HslJ